MVIVQFIWFSRFLENLNCVKVKTELSCDFLFIQY